jgi:hypothetical protein
MGLEEDVVKIYFVNDPKGNYLYWLNKIEMPTMEESNCPKTTMWDKSKVKKEVYMLKCLLWKSPTVLKLLCGIKAK